MSWRGTFACALMLANLTLVAVGAGSASAACGQTIQIGARTAPGAGPAPVAVGDSVLYDAAKVLSGDGIQSDAMVCRTMAQGVVWLQQHAARLPPLVVVALGTNGSVTVGQINEILAIVGPQRLLAMVTPHHGNYAYVPGLIRAVAQQHPARIMVLDWDRLSAGHPDWFAPDGIHLGSAAGIDAFAQLVAGSLLAAPSSTSTTTPVPIAPPPAKPKQQAKPPATQSAKPVDPRHPARTQWATSSVGSVLSFLSPLLLDF